MLKYLLAISFIFILFAFDTKANFRAFTTYNIESEIMGESLDLHIQLPLFYAENDHYRYPVIYVLDAPVGLTLTAGVLDPLVGYDNAPQMIIVGITTSNRARDLTPSVDLKAEPVSGGANKYLSFIAKEVIPFIDQNYRTEKFRILSGHSYGGLFVMYAFHTQPDLFQAHFAYSPSLHWNDKKTVAEVVAFIENNKTHKNFLYMNIGNENEGDPGIESPEGKGMYAGLLAIEDSLKKSATKSIDYTIERFPNERHQTTQIVGTVSSFRHLYPQWSAPYVSFLQGYESVLKHFDGLSKKYGYQIEPRNWLMNDEGLYQLEEQNNPLEALKYFTYNEQNNPSSISALQNLVKTYIKLDNSEKALLYINKLLAVPELNAVNREKFERQKAILLDNPNGH